MPKANRYHPYARPTPPFSARPVAPPQYYPPTTLHYGSPTSSITEYTSPLQPSMSNHTPPPAPIGPYEPIYPGYIQAMTSDGARLVAKSVVRDRDGTYIVHMAEVGFPSLFEREKRSSDVGLGNVDGLGYVGRGLNLDLDLDLDLLMSCSTVVREGAVRGKSVEAEDMALAMGDMDAEGDTDDGQVFTRFADEAVSTMLRVEGRRGNHQRRNAH